MTVEEALVSLLAITALVLLFLGLSQALEGRPRALRARGARVPWLEAPASDADTDEWPEPREVVRTVPAAALAGPPAPVELEVRADLEPRGAVEPPAPAITARSSPFARRPAPPAYSPPDVARPALDTPPPEAPSRPVEPPVEGIARSVPPLGAEAVPTADPSATAASRITDALRRAARENAPLEPDGDAAPPGPARFELEGQRAPADAAPAERDPSRESAGPSHGVAGATSRGASVPVEPDDRRPHTGHAAPTAPALLVDRVAALFLAGKYGDVIAQAESLPAGAGEWSGTMRAALWSLSGLTRRELGDTEGAAADLSRAADLAPREAPESCPPRMAAAALAVARRLLDDVGGGGDGAMPTARLARFWLRCREAAAPGDQDAKVLMDAAAGVLASGAGEAVLAHLRTRQWGAARRAADEARERGDVDEARGLALDRTIGSAVKREVERLVTPAIRGGRAEDRTVRALDQADALLASLDAGVLSQSQRAGLDRRVAWAHARLGIQRVRAGSLEAGLDALGHALGRKGLGAERLRRVRETVVEALDALVVRASRELDQANGREDGAALVRELEQHIERARALGMPARLLAPVEERAARIAGAPAGDA